MIIFQSHKFKTQRSFLYSFLNF